MISIAGDHFTVNLVNRICSYLDTKGFEYTNYGSTSEDEIVTLQEMIPKTLKPVIDQQADSAILICGTGAGVEIGANRFKRIRASLCIEAKQAKWARVYDNANVLCLSSWLTNDPTGILEAWFSNEFDNDPGRSEMIKHFDTDKFTN